ncbi:MAG: DUF6262 family protein [Actinomycetota bacterium]
MTSPDTLAQVEHACTRLLRDGQPVTFSNVAERAGVSRTTLYRDDALRAVVEEHRARSHDPRTLTGLATEIGHLRTAVETLAERVRRHDEQLRRIDRKRKAR